MIPDEQLASALRSLLALNCGFHIGFAWTLRVGQLENLNYWVEERDVENRVVWEKDDIPLEEAIAHFLRIRNERQMGFDIEIDLNPGLGHIGPQDKP